MPKAKSQKDNPLDKLQKLLEKAPTWVKQLAAVLVIVVPIIVGLFQLDDVKDQVPLLDAQVESLQDTVDLQAEQIDLQDQRLDRQAKALDRQGEVLADQKKATANLKDATANLNNVLDEVQGTLRTIIQNAIDAGLL